MSSTPANAFLQKTEENGDFNQYWYSQNTLKHLVEELLASATKAACLSTPSVYYSLPKDSDLFKNSYVFDLDEQWATDPHFVKYDFKVPEAIPKELHHTFDCVVIDPPFITADVWDKYAEAAKLLLQPGGKVIASTVAENAPILEALLGAKPVAFKPSIPNLVYQYNLFLNFEPKVLNAKNVEIPDDD